MRVMSTRYCTQFVGEHPPPLIRSLKLPIVCMVDVSILFKTQSVRGVAPILMHIDYFRDVAHRRSEGLAVQVLIRQPDL